MTNKHHQAVFLQNREATVSQDEGVGIVRNVKGVEIYPGSPSTIIFGCDNVVFDGSDKKEGTFVVVNSCDDVDIKT